MTRRAALIALVALIIGLIGFAPLRLLLPAPPLAARAVNGSVWQGQIMGARIGGVALGDLAVKRKTLFGFGFANQAGLHGDFSLWSRGVSGVSGVLDDRALLARFGADQLVLSDVELVMARDGCRSARGRIRARLAQSLAGLVAGQSLAGDLRCDRRTLTLALASVSGAERIEWRVKSDGSVVAQLSVARGDAARDAALRSAGFVESAERFVRILPGLE